LLANQQLLFIVKFIFLDILNNEIKTHLRKEKTIGTDEINWYEESAGGGLPSGIYFYRIQVYPAIGGAGDHVEP
jgi:hypothetical protein